MTGEFGYTGKILNVDLSTGKSHVIPTKDYADRFIGGRGIAAKIYWDEMSPDVGPLDERNSLVIMTGPLAGFLGIAGSRWQISGKSPALTNPGFSHGNLGGIWGAELKFAGYDGMIIRGKSDKPVYLLIEDGNVQIKDAAHLWGKKVYEVRDALKAEYGNKARVTTIGPGGESMVEFATVVSETDSTCGGGFGAVFGSKKLKALVVRGSGKAVAAQPEKLRELTSYVRALRKEKLGWLPEVLEDPKMKKQACFGCISGCERATFTPSDGRLGKFTCQSGRFYRTRAQRFYGEWNEVPFLASRTLTDYGLDSDAIEPMIMWLLRLNKAEIVTEHTSGIPITKAGSLEFMQKLCESISSRQGFGDVLAHGTIRAADIVGGDAKKYLGGYINQKDGGLCAYDPRLYITAGILWAMEERPPRAQLHEMTMVLVMWLKNQAKQADALMTSEALRGIAKKFWGSELAGDYSTYAGKALAGKMIQDREYVKESLILCDLTWPIMWSESRPDFIGDPSAENKLFSAVTGQEVDEHGLYKLGEKVMNLQRAILAREGHVGRACDKLPDYYYTQPLQSDAWNDLCMAPGKDGAPFSKRGTVLDRQAFERMMDEYYQLRGWDVPTGLQTRSKLEELGLKDIADVLEKEKLLAKG